MNNGSNKIYLKGWASKILSSTSTLEYALVVLVIICLSIPIILSNIATSENQQFIYLAQSFLNGNLYFDDAFIGTKVVLDYSYFNGHYYWPQAPFSAAVLLPFVAIFGSGFLQGYLQILLIPTIMYAVFKLVIAYGVSKKTALYFSFLFIFGSITYGLAIVPWSYYFSQLLSILFLLVALYYFKIEKSLWRVGLLVACAIATRFTLIIAPVYFVASILLQPTSNREKLLKLVKFFIPLVILGTIVLMYNYLRFESPFLTGYEFFGLGDNDWYNFGKYGLFNLQNIPGNLYYYFLKMPTPVFDIGSYHLVFPYIVGDFVSLSFFVVAPFFINIFKVIKSKIKEVHVLWGVALLQLVFLLSHYSPGTLQFLGPRYMLDVLPWLLILLAYVFSKQSLTTTHKLIIIGSGIFNLYLIITGLLYYTPFV